MQIPQGGYQENVIRHNKASNLQPDLKIYCHYAAGDKAAIVPLTFSLLVPISWPFPVI